MDCYPAYIYVITAMVMSLVSLAYLLYSGSSMLTVGSSCCSQIFSMVCMGIIFVGLCGYNILLAWGILALFLLLSCSSSSFVGYQLMNAMSAPKK
jgi:hypothetical protein